MQKHQVIGPNGLDSWLTEVGLHLRDSFRTLLDAVPGAPTRPQELMRALGLKKDLSSRILRSARKQDPIAILHTIPGPEALRQLTSAARSRGVPAEAVKRADDAVAAFEDLMRTVAEDRSSLDAIISSRLPDARDKFELLSKQSVYKGTSRLKGVATDLQLDVGLMYPSTDGDHIDVIGVTGAIGLRRLRPGVPIRFSTRLIDCPSESRCLTLNGEPAGEMESILLRDFCSPGLEVRTQRAGNALHHMVEADGIGPRSAVNLMTALVGQQILTRYKTAGKPDRHGVFSTIDFPAAALNHDLLVHKDVYPDSQPSLLIYDTALYGVANMHDQSRDIDRWALQESIRFVGHGPSCLRISEVPYYVDLIRYLCERMNWPAEEFRAYRCRIAYPIYGSQVVIAFTAPPRETELTTTAL